MSIRHPTPSEWTCQRRSAVALVRTALSVYDDAQSAWETLAVHDALPESWLDAPAREFCVAPSWDQVTKGAPVRRRHPGTVEACLAVAARLEDLLNAEALGWALACCLREWGGAWPARVRWVLSPAPLPHATTQTALPRVASALAGALAIWRDRAGRARAMRDRSATRRAAATARYMARADVVRREFLQLGVPAGISAVDPTIAACASAWARSIRLGVGFNANTTRRYRLPSEWAGRSVADLLDPLEPLAELSALGVSLGPITDEALHLSVAILDDALAGTATAAE